MEFGVGPDADSGVSPVLPGRLTEREFAAFLGPRNSVAAIYGDAEGFSTLRKAAMQWTPTSRRNTPHRPCYFDDRGGIHARDLDRCYHIRRFISVHYCPRRWYMVRPLRDWIRRDELRFLLI